MRTIIPLVAVAVATLAAACRPSRDAPKEGQLSVEWQGSDRGHFAAPAIATHCPETGLVELLAVRGDSGVGLALFPVDSGTLAAAIFPIFAGSDLNESRPGANAAIRWFAGATLAVFEGQAGQVTLVAAGTTLSGTIEVRMHAVSGTDTLRATGRFDGVPVTRGGAGCGRLSRRNLI
jgi:hypothetical protein